MTTHTLHKMASKKPYVTHTFGVTDANGIFRGTVNRNINLPTGSFDCWTITLYRAYDIKESSHCFNFKAEAIEKLLAYNEFAPSTTRSDIRRENMIHGVLNSDFLYSI